MIWAGPAWGRRMRPGPGASGPEYGAALKGEAATAGVASREASPGRAYGDAPETVPLPAVRQPAPMPDGVLGYNVATRLHAGDGSLGWLASADLMSPEHAGHALKAIPGGVLVELREAAR